MKKQKINSDGGVREQRPYTFLIDSENAEWLETKRNKDRTINDALKAKREFETTMNL